MTAISRTILFASLISLFAAACSADGPATCDTVTDHVMRLRDDERRDQGLEPLSPESAALRRKRSIEQCEMRGASPQELECLMAAQTRDQMRTCQSSSQSASVTSVQ